MIGSELLFEITRLKNAGWSDRKIARNLGCDRTTVKKYVENPYQQFKKPPPRKTKLTAYRYLIGQWLKEDPEVKATVVLQRLSEKGFTGKITIVRDLLRELRGRRKYRQAYIRFESGPGEQMQIDWGHFGALVYGETTRKLYALAVLEAHSRMLYVEFTHSQKQQTLHQCLLNAFLFFGGAPREMVVDNMLTAVTERRGTVIRFNDAFLDFLRIFGIRPVACNPGAPHEKGKVEAAIKYIRRNFWPLRSFADLADVNRQVRQWLDATANVRLHQTTGKSPVERFEAGRLKRLPDLLPDCREVCLLKVHKDFAVRFDGNSYSVPPWSIGKKLTLKADAFSVAMYHREKQIAAHARCWQRHQRIETEAHGQQVKRLQRRLWHDREIAAFASLGEDARRYLEGIIAAGVGIKKNVAKILALKNEYGAGAIVAAVRKALSFGAYGADYIENILYQEMTPCSHHPPVRLKNDALNRIVLTQPSLSDYDAHVLKKKGKSDE